MNAGELISLARIALDDERQPYLWTEEELLQHLVQAQQDACVRGKLILDDITDACCEIALTAGVSRYALHEKVLAIAARWGAVRQGRRILARIYEQRFEVGSGTPTVYWEGHRFIELYPAPSDDAALRGPIRLSVYRLPLADPDDADGELEIHPRYYEGLVFGLVARAYGRTDADTYAPDKAALAEAEFTRWFGSRPDANVQRKHHERRAPVVRSGW